MSKDSAKVTGQNNNAISTPGSTAPAGDLGEAFEKLETKFQKMKEEFDKDKTSFIKFCGIFVSIFTFISVDVQILKTISNVYQLVGFVFVFAALLMGFVLILDYLINDERNIRKFGIITVVLIAFVIIGLYLISFSSRSNIEASSIPSIVNSPTTNVQFSTRMNIKISQ